MCPGYKVDLKMYYQELILLASMEKPFEQPQAIVYILHF